ncbi:FAD-binding protein [Plantibacter sp. CFBP 8775]|uniref:FAD-binding protein n=1 Tax=Plantibacter sp. CFBP 8775 TaxID=2774038 RepID=UPI0017852A8D|nr:FAD-binding protein [Plantibacter sp. CFBP 8775]MBD8101984.1 FAD-binding protein [Plantibacter sp. CFBP 8775]
MTLERNWAGTHTFAAPRIVNATSIDEVRALVAEAARTGTRVRALGTRHSFTDLADSEGTLITVLDIPADPVFDEAAGSVTIGAGTRYGIAAAWLAERGLAFHNMGSLPHISIGGAIATGTHGSGNDNGILSSAVSGLEYVDATGELVHVRRGDPGFDGLVVGLGAYGIVVRVTVDVQPAYRVRQDVYRDVPWDAVLADFEGVTGGAYSVSIFTNWLGDTVEQIWWKTRLAAGNDELPVVPESWLGVQRDSLAAGNLVETDPDNLTLQGGVPGDWWERLPHFRLESTPSNGDEIQTEYFIDRADGPAAITALRALGDRIAPLLLVTELRTAAPDKLWLSGAYHREMLAVHFTWRNLPEEVRAVLPAIEEALAPFGARPHWGKLNLLTAERIAEVVPRLADARDLFEELDPDGTFSNAHLERIGVRLPR